MASKAKLPGEMVQDRLNEAIKLAGELGREAREPR
jgi:hypothetical protein